MKIYSLQASQFGDAIISLRVSEYLKEKYPNSTIIGGIARKYSSILPLLKTAPYLDDVIIWEGCPSAGEPSFPTENDKKLIEQYKFDLFLDPFKPNHRPDFYRYCHQVEDVFLRHGFEPPKNLQINLPKIPAYPNLKNTVAFSPFPNFGVGVKCLSLEKAQRIVDYIKSKGLEVIQLGSNIEPTIQGAMKIKQDWLETARILNSVKFFITTDTCSSWIASSYKIKTIGLYGWFGYYNNVISSRNWEPINPHATYLRSDVADSIPDYLIFEEINNLLN